MRPVEVELVPNEVELSLARRRPSPCTVRFFRSQFSSCRRTSKSKGGGHRSPNAVPFLRIGLPFLPFGLQLLRIDPAFQRSAVAASGTRVSSSFRSFRSPGARANARVAVSLSPVQRGERLSGSLVRATARASRRIVGASGGEPRVLEKGRAIDGPGLTSARDEIFFLPLYMEVAKKCPARKRQFLPTSRAATFVRRWDAARQVMRRICPAAPGSLTDYRSWACDIVATHRWACLACVAGRVLQPEINAKEQRE